MDTVHIELVKHFLEENDTRFAEFLAQHGEDEPLVCVEQIIAALHIELTLRAEKRTACLKGHS